MDIACPNCGATYRVPDALIDGASALRCVACGHAWVPDPPPPAAVEVAAPVVVPPPASPPPEPEPEPEPEPVAPPPPLPEPSPPVAAAPPIEALAEAPAAEVPPARSTLPPMRSDVTLSLTATRAGPPELAPRRRVEAPPRRRRRSLLPLAWAVSIAIVIAFVLALAVYGTQLSAAWPPLARLVG